MNFFYHPRVFLLPLLLISSLSAQEIRIAASDLLATSIEEPLREYASEREMEVVLDSIGSLPALDKLRANEIDLAIIAVPEDAEVPRREFTVYPFAYAAAVVAVNENNPISEISLSQLGAVFGSQEELNVRTWGDLGFSGWGNRSIKALSGTAESSIALELFKYSVFKGGGMKSGVAMVNASEIEGLLNSDASSIGILSHMPKHPNLKVLMVAPDSRSPAFGPTSDNIHFGDYPIRLSFYLVFKQRDQSRLKPIVRRLLGDEVAAGLKGNDLIALPETVRRKLLVDLDLE
jgi:ABC-type phosphate transport system substrate-binding protein